MKQTKHMTALLLVALLAASCGGTAPAADDTAPADTTAAETTAPSEYQRPDADYAGRAVRIGTYEMPTSSWKISDYRLTLTEENGDIINDALVKTRRTVEEELNVTIEPYYIDKSEALTTPVLAGDDEYDFAMIMTKTMPTLLVMPSMLVDLSDVATLDLSHSWWHQGSVEEFNIKGTQYAAVGDICFYNTAASVVTYINKQLVEDFKLGDPYQMVRDGKWTIDKMADMCKTVSSDLNGNSEVDVDDRFGLLCENGSMQYFVTAAGTRFADWDDSGELGITVYNERTVDVVEKIVTLFNIREQVMMAHQWKGYNNTYFDLFLPTFYDNRALFYSNQMLVALEMRAMNGDFGILPTPKLDEAQKEYYSIGSTAWSDNLVIPATNTNLDMTGHVIDALGYYAQQYATPAFIDYTVLNKSVRDEGSAEMINLILDTQTFDIGYIFNWGNMRSMLTNMVSKQETGYATAFEAIRPAVEAALEKTLAELN